jgi:hypothetical protein
MGGLDCEVDVVESVDTAVEAEGAVSAAWKARCRRYRAATGRGHARPHDPGERLTCGSPHAGIPPGADAYRRFNRRESVALSHVVETSRLAHHVGRMSRKEPKRSGGSDQNKAIARWDNEGGAPKAPQEDRNELAPLTNEEEHILRCLGAAVIMQWNDLPTKIQRELFEHASSMGELNHTAELKGQVARFLHQHKDDGRESA